LKQAEEFDGEALLVQGFDLRVEQRGVELRQAGEQRRVAAEDRRIRHECAIGTGTQLALQRAEPAGIHVEHQVGPGLPVDGIAGVYGLRIDDHQRATLKPLARIAVEVGAATRGDRTDREGLVAMRRVADLASILDRAGLDKGQGGVAPEAWLGALVCVAVHVVPAVVERSRSIEPAVSHSAANPARRDRSPAKWLDRGAARRQYQSAIRRQAVWTVQKCVVSCVREPQSKE